MAEKDKQKRRVIKPAKTETVRERAAKSTNTEKRPRRIKRAANSAKRPLGGVGRVLAKALRPFSFLLRPFQTRPARGVGRFLAKVLLLNYLKSSWGELRQVQWPNRRQTAHLTFAVFVFAIALAGIVAGTDWLLDKAFKQILLQ